MLRYRPMSIFRLLDWPHLFLALLEMLLGKQKFYALRKSSRGNCKGCGSDDGADAVARKICELVSSTFNERTYGICGVVVVTKSVDRELGAQRWASYPFQSEFEIWHMAVIKA